VRSPRADECDPLPGGPGAPVDRHKDRSARSALNRRLGCKRAKHPRARDVGKPGSGAEARLDAFGLASAAARRRKAGAAPLPDPPPQAGRKAGKSRSRARASIGGNAARCCAANGWIAPFGASPPFFCRGRIFGCRKRIYFWNGVVGTTRTLRCAAGMISLVVIARSEATKQSSSVAQSWIASLRSQ
jgi:hypothetical protein